jgi:hypothetical protein
LHGRCLVLGEQLQQTLAAFVVHHVVSSNAVCFVMRRGNVLIGDDRLPVKKSNQSMA